MKLYSAILVWLVLLCSCGHRNAQENSLTTKTQLRTDTASVEGEKTATIDEQKEEIISPYQIELNLALADTAINDYYKKVYREEKLMKASDSLMLTITENIFTNDSSKDLFYFIVFTKSMNGSDGFYSEALGLSSLKFITIQTSKFADWFNIAPKLTDQDMTSWAQFIYNELKISREKHETEALKNLENQLLGNIRVERKEYRLVIERLIGKLNSNATYDKN